MRRFDSVTWAVIAVVAGALVLRDRFHFNRHSTAFPVTALSPSHSTARTHQEMDDLGLYAQGHFRWTQRLAATAGLRAYRTKQDASNAFWRTDAQFVPTQQVYDAPSLHTSGLECPVPRWSSRITLRFFSTSWNAAATCG